MASYELQVESEPAMADVAALGDGLTTHSLPTVGEPGFLPLAVFARDADGTLVGGVSGKVNWNWVHVELLWVSEPLRKQGLGTKLLTAIESAARERGCEHAHLDTFSYQARPFYERQGYELFGQLDDYPPGQSRFFLRKRLSAGR